jgi:hypothetical protein
MPATERDVLWLVSRAPKHGIGEYYAAYGSPTERHADGRQGTGGEGEFSAIWRKNVDTPWSPTKVRAHVVRTELREAFEDVDVSEHARDALEGLKRGGEGG